MSEESVEIVRGAFAAFERGEISEMIDLMTDDLVTHRIEPDNAIYHGKEGFFQATADWTEGFEEWTATAVEFVDAGRDVLVRVHQTARGEGSGAPVESDFWFVFTMREGKIARLSFHTSRTEAFAAARLAE